MKWSKMTMKVSNATWFFKFFIMFFSVFFGHEIPVFGISANITEIVRNRAIACSKEPELRFHYSESDNCE